MKNPLVSIIIVNWNGGEVLRQCLESLSKVEYPHWELIMVDNGSTDGSEKIAFNLKLKIKNLKLIRNSKNLGFATANNLGYKKAKGDYVLLLNNDTLVDRFFLKKLVERGEQDLTLGVIQPKIYLMDKPGYLDNAGSFITKIGFWHHWGYLQKDSVEFNQERDIFSAKGACMLIRRAVIEKVGLFDPDFISYFEETDFCWRVWLSGFRVIYYPSALIYHKVGYTIRRLSVLDNNYNYYKNRISSQLKNFEIKNIVLILIFHLCLSVGISFVFLIRGNISNFFMIIKAIFWNFLNISEIINKRNSIQSLRVVTDDKLFESLSVPVDWKKFLGDFKRIEEDIKRKTIV